MPLRPELIQAVSQLKEGGMKGKDIARKLGISRKDVTILLRGYLNEREYLRDLKVGREKYTKIIEKNLDGLVFLGWPIRRLITHRSATIYFSELFESVEVRIRDLEESLRVNTARMGLKRIAEGIEIDYHNGIYFLTPQTIQSKAFLPPYAKMVLGREVEN